MTHAAPGHIGTRYLLLTVAGAAGIFFATAVYTFSRAEGASYFSDDPASCANCHIMSEQYDAWQRGPHQHAAVCNDCHTPSATVAKYASKGINGFNHSFAFTTGIFHDPIQIKDFNRRIVEQSCRSCHGPLMQNIHGLTVATAQASCTRCHADVGH